MNDPQHFIIKCSLVTMLGQTLKFPVCHVTSLCYFAKQRIEYFFLILTHLLLSSTPSSLTGSFRARRKGFERGAGVQMGECTLEIIKTLLFAGGSFN